MWGLLFRRSSIYQCRSWSGQCLGERIKWGNYFMLSRGEDVSEDVEGGGAAGFIAEVIAEVMPRHGAFV